jgi:conjugal transfer/entry exclusion protein
MTFRRSLMAGVAALALLWGVEVANAQGIPVIDAAALTQWVQSIANEVKAYALQVQQWTTQNLAWTKQIQQYATQLQQYAQEVELYENFFHNPSLGAALGLMNGAGLGNALPVNGYAALGLVNGLSSIGAGGQGFSLAGLTGILGNLSALSGQSWTASHIYTPTDGSWASQQMIARANGIAGYKGAGEAAYNDLRTHANTLQPLRDDLLASTDTKSVLDASGAMQTEIAWNVNQMAQMQAIQMDYQAHSDSLVQRDNERMDADIESFLRGSPAQALGGSFRNNQ